MSHFTGFTPFYNPSFCLSFGCEHFYSAITYFPTYGCESAAAASFQLLFLLASTASMIIPYSVRRTHTIGLCMLILKQCLSLRVAYNFGPLGHIHTSKQIWKAVVRPGDIVIDATCGNGHDALFLAKLALTPTTGRLFCIDIQHAATSSTRSKFETDIAMNSLLEKGRINIITESHETFPECINEGSVRLICYNLGYLPGGTARQTDVCAATAGTEPKARLITKADTTIKSLTNALPLIMDGGLLSVVAYPGHEGGDVEMESVKRFMAELNDQEWRVYGNFPLNRPKSPVLISAFKIDKTGGSKETEFAK